MTLVDQRRPAPQLTPGARRELAAALDRDPVVAALLFGSHARGGAGPLSDVDIAVIHSPGLEPREASALRLKLSRLAAQALGSDEVDVVLLNEASPLLRHRAFRDGQLLVERDPVGRVRFQTQTIREYLDTEPLRAELGRGLARRFEEGRFGRH